MAAVLDSVSPTPFEPISMIQDDSKQWEHLLSQENHPDGLILHHFAPVNLHSISTRSRIRADSALELPKKATWTVEADEHKTGRSWAQIPSTGAEQHLWMIFDQQK